MDRKVTIVKGEMVDKVIFQAQLYLYEIAKQNKFENKLKKEATS